MAKKNAIRMISQPLCSKLIKVIDPNAAKVENLAQQENINRLANGVTEENKTIEKDRTLIEYSQRLNKPRTSHRKSRVTYSKSKAPRTSSKQRRDMTLSSTQYQDYQDMNASTKYKNARLETSYSNTSMLNKTMFGRNKPIDPLKYNLVLTDKSRYLEIASATAPPSCTAHIPSIKFDRIIMRNSFLNASLDVNENRFKVHKVPENWSKNKRVPNISLNRGSKSGYLFNFLE
jgi:hypothetical protein